MIFVIKHVLYFFHQSFIRCFSTELFPDVWNNAIINPIPKSNMSDNGDPLCYRGVALALATYKLYCKLLNGRLSQWIYDNNGLADEQKSFRKGRSTVDQITSLTNINIHCLAIKSLYNGAKCSVRVNSFSTDWFSVKCGLKQI